MTRVSLHRKRTEPAARRAQPPGRRPATRRDRGTSRKSAVSARALAARRKFLRAFPFGFRDETYLAWERDYKWKAHRQWTEALGRDRFRALLRERAYSAI